MVRWSHVLYFGLSWAYVIGLAFQVFLIGLGLPQLGNTGSSIELHRNFGWLIHLLVFLVLLFALLSRAGRTHWGWALALTVVVFLVPLVVGMRTSNPTLAALHPVLAALAFALAVTVAINATRLFRSDRDRPIPTT
jgi:hypothetical protein